MATTRPNITSTHASDQHVTGPSRAPRREEIAAAKGEVLKAAGPSKADLYVVDLGDGPMVVKDFAAKPWWARRIGRYLIAREIRAYRWLGEMQGVPRLIGRIDSHALALEKIEGVMMYPAVRHQDAGEILLPRIRALIDRLHAKGLAHLDLNRENLMRRQDDQVAALDLAGAVWLRPGGLWHRLFFRVLATADETAYLKWKVRLTPGTLDPDEQKRFRRLRALRALWPFNRRPTKPDSKL